LIRSEEGSGEVMPYDSASHVADEDVYKFSADLVASLNGAVQCAASRLLDLKLKLAREQQIRVDEVMHYSEAKVRVGTRLDLSGAQQMSACLWQILELRVEMDDLNASVAKMEADCGRLSGQLRHTRESLISSNLRQSSRALGRVALRAWRDVVHVDQQRRRLLESMVSSNSRKRRVAGAFLTWCRHVWAEAIERERQQRGRHAEEVSREIVRQYEDKLIQLRRELGIKEAHLEEERLGKERVERRLQRAYLGSVTAMNLKALTLFSKALGPMADTDVLDGDESLFVLGGLDEQPRPPLRVVPARGV
jgi:hypothetical protein